MSLQSATAASVRDNKATPEYDKLTASPISSTLPFTKNGKVSFRALIAQSVGLGINCSSSSQLRQGHNP